MSVSRHPARVLHPGVGQRPLTVGEVLMLSPARDFFTKHETRDTKHGLFPTRGSKQGPLVLKPFSLFLASLHFSPRGETKWVRGPSGRGASRLARAGVLEQYVEHGKQAQRSPGGHTACFGRRVVRNAGSGTVFSVSSPSTGDASPLSGTKTQSEPAEPAARSACFPARCGSVWGGYGAAWAAYCQTRDTLSFAPSEPAARPVGFS